MSYSTGGRPRAWRLTVDTTGIDSSTSPLLLEGLTKWVRIRNKGANILRIFYNAEDFAADRNYVELAASTGEYNEPDEINKIWLKSTVGATTAELKVNFRAG